MLPCAGPGQLLADHFRFLLRRVSYLACSAHARLMVCRYGLTTPFGTAKANAEFLNPWRDPRATNYL